MVEARKLTAAEMQLARTVYAASIPFDRVYLTNLDLGSAVTLAGVNGSTGKFDYTVNWKEGFGGVMTDKERRATLVHKLLPCVAGRERGLADILHGSIHLVTAVKPRKRHLKDAKVARLGDASQHRL